MSVAGLIANGWQPDNTADSTFNLNAQTMVKIRTALSFANSNLVPMLIVGNSTSSGYQVTGPETPDTAWPGILRNSLIALGVQDGGVNMPTADLTHPPQWTYDAHWTQVGPLIFSNLAGAVATYLSTNKGTRVTLFYSDQSVNFGFTIDGGANNPVVPGGTQTIKSVTVTGLANAVHSVAITASAANMFPISCMVGNPNGLVLCHFAMSGSGVVNGYANAPGTAGNWASTVVNSLGWMRQQQIFNALTGARPEGTYKGGIGLFCVGANDIANGQTIAALVQGYETVMAASPPMAWGIVQEYRSPLYSNAVQATIRTAMQAFAIKHGIPIFDWDMRLGGYDAMLAAGLLQSDAAHPTASDAFDLGTSMAYQMLT